VFEAIAGSARRLRAARCSCVHRRRPCWDRAR
jgi:hypothetical protein